MRFPYVIYAQPPQKPDPLVINKKKREKRQASNIHECLIYCVCIKLHSNILDGLFYILMNKNTSET